MIEFTKQICYYEKRKAPTPKWMLPKVVLTLFQELPLSLADERGIFISAYLFSCRESSATQLTANRAISANRSLPEQPYRSHKLS